MSNKEFKFIKGKCCAGSPADICFYTDVDYWSVDNFLWEFDYLVNYVSPSEIRIHINSVGGSCVEGMSVFAKIMDCKIPTKCINDALAASMGSIIWAAGDELYMKDYALLMIHNPFCENNNGDKEYNQVTEAFTQQLKTIYTKRFGLSDEEVQDIMDGKEGNDGTFLTAAQAVERGFVSADHIIETPKAIRDQIHAALKDVDDMAKIKAVLGLAAPQLPKATINEKDNQQLNSKTMEKNEINVVAALFGLTGEKATAENVSAQINEMKAKIEQFDALQASLEDTKNQLTKAQAELAGAETSVKNLTADLENANAALKQYKDAEDAAKADKVNALIEKAITDCKINMDEKETYIKIAENDFTLAESILAKIPARDNLGNIISEANKEVADKNIHTTEQQVQAKVDEVVGKSFKFRTIE